MNTVARQRDIVTSWNGRSMFLSEMNGYADIHKQIIKNKFSQSAY